MTIYIGNLSHSAHEDELNDLFSEFGEIKSVKIIKDNFTGKSKGFAFVEMEEETEASEAIEALNETEFLERTIVVSKARPKTNDNRSGGNSNYGGGYNKGGNSGGYNKFNKRY